MQPLCGKVTICAASRCARAEPVPRLGSPPTATIAILARTARGADRARTWWESLPASGYVAC
jgi:hypothetical protein